MPTNRKISIGLITFLVAVLAIFAATATADGQHSGEWKLNPAKSTYSPGPGPKDLTETIVLGMNRYKVHANGTAADGRPTSQRASTKSEEILLMQGTKIWRTTPRRQPASRIWHRLCL